MSFTRSQRTLLASHALQSDTAVQTMAHLLTFEAAIDPRRLAAAFDQVVQHADVLRSRVVAGEAGLELSLWEGPPAPTPILSMARQDVTSWVQERANAPLELGRAAYDSVVLDHGGGDVSWYLAFDHLVTDAASSALVVAATSRVYEGESLDLASYYEFDVSTSVEPDPGAPFTQAQVAQAQVLAAGPVGRLYEKSDGTTATSSRVVAACDTQLTQAIEDALSGPLQVFNRDLSVTSLLLTATSIYLFALTGERSFSLGMPVGQRDEQTRSVIGPFMQPWAVPVMIDEAMSVRELHKSVTRSMFDVLKQAQRGQASTGGYDVIVNVIPHSAPANFNGHPVSMAWVRPNAIDPTHILRVQLTGYDQTEAAASLAIDLDLNHSAASPDHRVRAASHFTAALQAVVLDLDQSVEGVELVGPEERSVVQTWEVGPAALDDPTALARRLQQALQSNAKPVVDNAKTSHRGTNYSGTELWNWASAVAKQVADQTVIGDRVTVELDPSAAAIAAVYGIVLAGRSFVPIDPSMPRVRRDQLADLAQASLRFDSEDQIEALRGHEAQATAVESPPTAEAYLLFTSGSTGAPKGVPISHQGLLDYLDFAGSSYFSTSAPPVAPLFSSLGFDLTLTTLFGPILAGGRIKIVGTGAAALPEIAKHRDINWIKATPSHLEILLRLLPAKHGIKVAVVGGEAFPSALASKLLAGQPNMHVFNEYGPTEAVVGCMIHRTDEREVSEGADVPIGRPAPGVELRVVSAAGARVPMGAVGELLISSRGVTSGYLSDPGAALASPFVELDGTRFYRSGDLVRLRDDQRLEYHGRADTQLKVGGRRLDPLEVEEALEKHPAITRAVVRLWSPTEAPIRHRCARCGLADNVPGTSFDGDGVCGTCRSFDEVAEVASAYFGQPSELEALLRPSGDQTPGTYDCLHLLSGGKDSTFALYKLVEMGLRPYVLTLDNGFISEGAKDNVRQTVADLGLDYEFATSAAMNDIFRESLAEHSNVCHGCYKAIYTLATNRAVELGIPAIITGLSRGQLFETRLVPAQFSGESDPEAIDRAVLRARMHYHRAPDAVNRLLDTDVFAEDELFDKVKYIDFYRYVDVELSEMLSYLDERSPWVRPADTGRSTNCLINVAGIHTHRHERGFHNYAIPYAWDVRLGHKTRAEAIDELEDDPELEQVANLLGEVGYVPRARQVLTAWVETGPTAVTPSPIELRAFLATHLPSWALPAAIVDVDTWPTNQNGKLDVANLPGPTRVHRNSAAMAIEASTESEARIIDVWQRQLGLEPIGVNDDFFALGGDSLAALNAISQLSQEIGTALPDEFAFMHTTPRDLAGAIDVAALAEQPVQLTSRSQTHDPIPRRSRTRPPPFSAGEASVLFEQRRRPEAVVYNLGRRYRIPGQVDHVMLAEHVRLLAQREPTLSWTYESPRVKLDESDRAEVHVGSTPLTKSECDHQASAMHRQPFDLRTGPFLRAIIQPLDDGSTDLTVVIHHAAGDRTSLDAFFDRVQRSMAESPLRGSPSAEALVDGSPFDYGDYWAWKSDNLDSEHTFWMDELGDVRIPYELQLPSRTDCDEPDGLLSVIAATAAGQLQTTRGTTPVAVLVAAAAKATADLFDGGRTELCLLASARNHPGTSGQFGYFLNPVPLRLDAAVADSPLLSQTLLGQANAQLGRRLANRSYPFAQLVANCRDAGLALPSSRVLVAWDDGTAPAFMGRPVRAEAMFNGTAVADLTFFAEVVGSEVRLSLEYSGTTVGSELATQLLDRFDTAITDLVTVAATGAASTITDAPALLVGEQPVAIGSVRDLFQQQLLSGSATAAVVCGDDRLDWLALATRSQLLAAALERHGVGPSARVVVELSRSTNLIVALMAIMERGASYVPVDPSYPAQQRTAVLEVAQPVVRIVETTGQTQSQIPTIVLGPDGIKGSGSATWPSRHDLAPTNASAPSLWPSISDTDEAYVIFTSGSTGVPRGVAVTHGQINASTLARDDWYPDRPNSFVVPSSSAFDSSIVGLFWTLAHGGAVILPTEAEAHDVDALVALLDRTEPSYLLCVPSLYRALITRSTTGQNWPAHVIVAGEACAVDVVTAHNASFADSALTNEYGPTECTVWATAHSCTIREAVTVPIGSPIAGSFVAVVDNDLNLCRVGERGQLVIGGAGVTAGYINAEVETNERFLATLGDATAPPGPVFLTGDSARIAHGKVYFHGRIDDQLNLGGRRVEPGEVESVLRSCPGVLDAVVIASDLRTTDELMAESSPEQIASAMHAAATSDDPVVALRDRLGDHSAEVQLGLIALVETTGDASLGEVQDIARAQLPRLLRPHRIELVDAVPYTTNGKVDRRAARSIAAHLALASTPTAAPVLGTPTLETADSDEIARTLCSLFGKVLRIDQVEPTESFFDIGGDSLSALDLLTAVEKSLGVSLSTSALFTNTSPVELANHIKVAAPDARPVSDRGLVIPIQVAGDRPPIFAINNLGTNAEYFRPVSAALGEAQPFYGLGASHQMELYGLVDYDPDRAVSVEGIAKTCVANIEEIAPTGPVIVTGLCGGAIHAYEVAQQLRAAGRQVGAFIVINDWQAPHLESRMLSHSARENWTRRWNHLRTLRGEYLAVLAGPVKRRIEQLEVELSRQLNRPLSHRLRVRQYIEESLASMDAYEYSPYPGRVFVIRGEDDPRLVGQEQQGWGELFADVSFHTVPAIGLDVLISDKVAVTAEVFRSAVDHVLDGS